MTNKTLTDMWNRAIDIAKKNYEEENGSWEDADKYEREDYTFAAYTKLCEEHSGSSNQGR